MQVFILIHVNILVMINHFTVRPTKNSSKIMLLLATTSTSQTVVVRDVNVNGLLHELETMIISIKSSPIIVVFSLVR